MCEAQVNLNFDLNLAWCPFEFAWFGKCKLCLENEWLGWIWNKFKLKLIGI